MLKFNKNSLQSDGFLVHHYEAIPSKCPSLARLLQSSTPCQFYKSWLASFPQPFKVSTLSESLVARYSARCCVVGCTFHGM
jgi:hypothetical protein